MPWDIYWTIVLQFFLAVAILTLPTAVAVFIVSSATYAARAPKAQLKEPGKFAAAQDKK